LKRNKLNDLDSKTWLKFQKSWFVHNPPPRAKNQLDHPAKFPETLAREFVEFFTKERQWVLDPMVGTGSALVASLRAGRNAVGVEINEGFCALAEKTVEQELAALERPGPPPEARVIHADARTLATLDLPSFDYCLTSPPYWDMLRSRGAQTQQERRARGLKVAYSDRKDDLGNISEYGTFVEEVAEIFRNVHKLLKEGAYLTVIVKNVKKKSRIYPLAWDLGKALGQFFALKDEKIWCQDNQQLRPYGLGSAWVSNTFHHYCLNFRKE
jgi:DNA modification methylase